VDKDHILDEIKRAAQENGGRPPGQSKFYKETGIRASDWSGKYWARWGDAVREAGFEPNTLQGAFDQKVIVGKFIGLMRELGHFPVRTEMRLKSRQDKTFPNEKTFGSHHLLVERIRKFCDGRPEYSDIVAMCPQVETNSESSTLPGPETDMGFVYLLKSGRYYKIGRTNSAGRRERELQILLPDKANIVHRIKTDDPAGIETYWHRRFEAKHRNGEWFELTADDVNAFRRRKFM
jgi:hypothetical protein